ncbi:decarboxylating NADP(+)-dependent phosphogluconate dehydrogenase [Alloiococcus sp. CFN-8]|uniref:decarboxylating NADP(+)-dependent phosphogluconate dehydrogenase n=1 Tax=Alloiococcus sp. CFN-8 TaxID=3416081 RepID=UPI003CE6F03A
MTRGLQVGIIGVGVMGGNLALNIEDKGFSVSVYDISLDSLNRMRVVSKGKDILISDSLKSFVESLESPRKIILMIKAGKAVENVIEELKKYITPGDIIIDCGNSYFHDSMRRRTQLEAQGYNFIDVGVSGGAEGALKGPSLMPGGDLEVYKSIEPILMAIAAKVGNEPCCTYIGDSGAGHYVKMVHNGIEYGDMELICEIYALLKGALKLSNDEISDLFAQWNNGELNSYLVEITSKIFKKLDTDSQKPMIDLILDVAGEKGTGKWSSESALNLGVPVPIITESVFSRYLSSMKEERVEASRVLSAEIEKGIELDELEFIESLRQAFYVSSICCYAQGFSLMRAASKEYKWSLNLGNIASVFRGGCIIRAALLDKIKKAYENNPELSNIMLDGYFKEVLLSYQQALRKVVITAISMGIAVPALSSAISYFDSYRTEKLPANLLQAQRDYFGGHTYQRIDKDRGSFFHTEW